MGLLTNPATEENSKKAFIVKYHGKLCLLMICSSIIWLGLLSNDNISTNTYFSENALLPGLVKSDYSEEHEAEKILSELRTVVARMPYSIPDLWLVEKFREFYVEAYIHNFTLNNPLKRDSKYEGKNVYGVLRAPRSASLEAVILAVPYRPPTSIYPSTLSGLALMYSVVKFFRKQKYWAKDIIFLITEHEQLGVQAWLDAYYGTTSGLKEILNHGVLEEHCGVIQAAINLEIHAPRISYFDVKIVGLNGQLPNLDLVNLVHRICSKEGVRSTFYNKDSRDGTKYSSWKHKFYTILEMIASQATSVPDGNHGLFHRFGIEALTIIGESKYGGGSYSFYDMGRVIEGLFRSLNNLLERFHQSYFFYLLPSTDRFISIGLYMPSLALLVSCLFIKSFATWLRLHLSDDGKKISQNYLQVIGNLNIMTVCSIILSCHVIGVILMPIGHIAVNILPWSSETSLLVAYVVVSVFSIFFFAFIVKFCKKNENWILLNVICLNEMGTFLLCVSMHNFSFGYVVALIYVLPTLWITSMNNKWYKKLVWLLFHPMLVLYWITLSTSFYTLHDLDINNIFIKSYDAMKNLLALNVTDAMIYGNWNFIVINIVLVPTWLSFWSLLNLPFDSAAKYEKIKQS